MGGEGRVRTTDRTMDTFPSKDGKKSRILQTQFCSNVVCPNNKKKKIDINKNNNRITYFAETDARNKRTPFRMGRE